MTAGIIDDKSLWDGFVDKSPYGLLFHKWDFLKIMEKYSGMQLLPYGIYKGNELICLFPLFFRRANGLKMLYSPPILLLTYIPYLGFVMCEAYDELRQLKKEHYLDLVVADFQAEIARLSPNVVSIYTAPRLTDVRSFLWGGYSMKTQYNYVIDLRDPVDALWGRLEKKLKARLRAMEKRSGELEIKIENDPHTMFRIMRKKLAGEGHTFWHNQRPEYLKAIHAAYPDNVRTYQLLENSEIVSMLVTIEYKGRVSAWMGGSPKDGDYSEYLTWNIMKMAKAKGFTSYENPDANTKRLCLFKTKFNPGLECCQYLYKKDAFGNMAGKAFYTAMNVPLLRGLIK
ncbi:MAG: GNAT family N-acetyltransferase [Methanocella sp.]